MSDGLPEFIPPIDMDAPIRVDHPLVHEPGLFIGMSEEEYHNALALSASGIKDLRVSTLHWWANSPLNPEREEEEEAVALLIGRAYHRRICEGPASFLMSFAPALEVADYPDALRTNEDLCNAIIEAGGPEKGLKAMRKAELIDRLLAYDPQAVIWERVVADHAAIHDGKIMLPSAVMRRIEIAAKMIEAHPQLSKAFSGGLPEASIFWVDEKTGVPCKSRLDYLKPRAIVDLKSFEARGMPLDRAIARAVATYKYNIQAAFYLRAAEEARGLIAEGRVSGAVDQDNLLRAIHDANDRTFLFVWQAKGIAPVAKGKVLAPGSVLDIGRQEVDQALHRWARCWQIFGTEPWVDVSDIETFDDHEFPAFLVE